MQRHPPSLGLLGALSLSLLFHGIGLALVASGSEPPPKPIPFAFASLGKLAQFQISRLAEGGRLVCASFPFLCEQEKFVELDLSLPLEVLPEEPIPTPEPIPEIAMVLPPEEQPENPTEVPPIEVTPPQEEKQPEEKQPEELAVQPTPPPPVVQPPVRLKSVEQIVEEEDAYNPDAHFLAEKTKIVEEETQARVTSDHKMDMEAGGVPDEAAPEAEEAGSDNPKVAGVEEVRAAPTEAKNPVRKENDVKPQENVTALPGEIKEGKKGKPGEAAPLAESLSEEALAVVTPGEGGSGGQGDKGTGTGGKADPNKKKGQPRLTLTMSDYEELYGKTEGAPSGQEEELSYGKGGKSEKRRKFVMAQLENYLPEVKPGNQTALSTAADPFARFLHQVHLRLHKKWGDGTLRDFDGLGGTNPLNNPDLVVTLEIVINPDGTLEKAAPVGSSGYLPYDVAAVTAVYDAGPFPKPPETIRSYNGKVYLRWALHRNARQCATAFAEPYILTGPPGGEAPKSTPPTPQ